MLSRLAMPLLVLSAAAQTPPTFEVASVKAAAPCCAPGQWRSPKAGEDRIDFRYVTLRYCIGFAFRVEDYQISGPPWLGDARFDIEAKAAEGTRHAQLPDMLKSLLAERFGLRTHSETKDVSALALVVTRSGPKLQESTGAADEAGASFGLSMSYEGVGKMQVKGATMGAFARNLSHFMHQPVVDQTGLTPRYDFDVEFSAEDTRGLSLVTVNGAPPQVSDSAVSIYSSIQKLGLKLDARKLPLEIVVVDHAEKIPTGN